MIHQALADALKGHQNGNAQILQVPDRADAGAQQMSRRMDGAAGQHDLAAAEFDVTPVDLRLHTGAARAFEQQLRHLRVGRDREIVAVTGLSIEIAHRGRDALLGLIGVGDWKVAFDEFPVLVRQESKASELARLGNGLRMCCPVRLRDTAHRNAAVFAVERPIEIEIALDLPEVGQHIIPAPARGTPRLPFVVVGRRAAIGQLAVDRGPASQDARLLVFAKRRALCLRVVVAYDLGGDLELGPVKAWIEISDARIAVQDLRWFVTGRRILSCLAKQDPVGAPGGQPVGQDGSRRSPADDDAVVHLWRFPCSLSCEASAAPPWGHASPWGAPGNSRAGRSMRHVRRRRYAWHRRANTLSLSRRGEEFFTICETV